MSDATVAPIVYINAREVRRRLGGVCGTTLRKYWQRGYIPAPARLGPSGRRATLLFNAAAVDAAIAALTVGAPQS